MDHAVGYLAGGQGRGQVGKGPPAAGVVEAVSMRPSSVLGVGM